MELVEQGYQVTENGNLPVDWISYNIADLVQSSGLIRGPFGGTLKKEFFVRNGFKVYEQKNAIYQSVELGNYYIDDNKFKELKRFEIYPNDFILSCSGTIGRIYKIPTSFERGIINQALLIIRLDENKINHTYFYYQFISDSIQNKVIDDTQGGAMKNLVGMAEFKKAKIPLPPTLNEQCAIAEALSSIDELINRVDKLLNKKKDIKQGAMQQLLTPPDKGGKRLSGFDGEWKEFTIDELCKTFTKQTGFDYSNHIKPTLLNENRRGTLPFIQNKDFDGQWVNFDTDYFIPTDVAERFPRILLNERCLMLSISGSIGKVGVFNNKQTAFIGGAVAVGKFKNPDYLNWVMYYLQSEKGQALMLKDVKAGSHQNLILDDIRKMNIPMPELNEQKAIVEVLENMEIEILNLEVKKSKYQQIKQGMMQELLTGKTRLV